MYGNMYGMGGGGYGGGYGMGGQGNETIIIICCCICCLCISSMVGGWFGNLFCSLSPSLGKSCGAQPVTPMGETPETTATAGTPAQMAATLKTCSESWGKAVRIGNDPRPPIRPEYCQSETRAVGRDCYYWEVQADPVTGMARWMRKADDQYGDMRSGAQCTASVQCGNRIDPAKLDRYSETEPDQLLRMCTAVQGTANNEVDALSTLTAEAQKVGATWIGPLAWTNEHSKWWYDGVLRYVGQKDLQAYITNSRKAADTLKFRLKSNTLRRSTFAYMLEAAVRAPTNSPDWIVNTTNSFAGSSESSYIAHLQKFIKNMEPWEQTMDGTKRTPIYVNKPINRPRNPNAK